jgi:CheY-like chemotaxis protein
MERGQVTQPRQHSPTADSPPDQRKQLRVLMVEDDRDTVETFALLLTAQGHDVRYAFDGPTGLEMARTWAPDAVLLDIGLPGMNGYELARRLHAESGDRRPFLIAITAYGDDQSRLSSEKVGIDLHLVKPVEIEDLQMVLDKFQMILMPDAG